MLSALLNFSISVLGKWDGKMQWIRIKLCYPNIRSFSFPNAPGRPAGMMTVSNRPDVTGEALLTVASKFGNALSYLFWKGGGGWWIKIEVPGSNHSVGFVTKLTSEKQTCAHS